MGSAVKFMVCALLGALLWQAVQGSAAIRDKSRRWPSRKVYYQFDRNVPLHTRTNVRNAMDRYERETCLRFIESSHSSSRILFQSDDSSCYSTSIGRTGGVQKINLGPRCNDGFRSTVSVALHEIGHAIGLYHEQSRPDRDSYVKVISGNIVSGKSHNFDKKSWSEVDTQSVPYDRRSIMHYGTTFFSKNGADTLQSKSSSHPIGPSSDLTTYDILTVNRMYSCPAKGVEGKLTVTALKGYRFPNHDGCCFSSVKSDSYMKITAVDANGLSVTRSSKVIHNDNSPSWNQDIEFGVGEWQFLRVSVLDEDTSWFTGNDDLILHEQVIPLYAGLRSRALCHNPRDCSRFAIVRSNLKEDSNECNPNPCKNGATCVDQVSDFTCICKRGFTGERCERAIGLLQVYVRRGYNLPDRDGFGAGRSDPYVRVTGYDEDRKVMSLRTSEKSGTHYPVWNQNLFFGYRSWKSIKVEVMDADGFFNGKDDSLLPIGIFTFSAPFSGSRVHRICNSSSCSRWVEISFTYSN